MKETITVQKRDIDSRKLERVAEILKSIAHPIRLDVIRLLEETEVLSVNQINARIPVEQSLLSHHLTKMKDRGVLSSSRSGKNIYYQLASKHIIRIFDCMEECDLF